MKVSKNQLVWARCHLAGLACVHDCTIWSSGVSGATRVSVCCRIAVYWSSKVSLAGSSFCAEGAERNESTDLKGDMAPRLYLQRIQGTHTTLLMPKMHIPGQTRVLHALGFPPTAKGLNFSSNQSRRKKPRMPVATMPPGILQRDWNVLLQELPLSTQHPSAARVCLGLIYGLAHDSSYNRVWRQTRGPLHPPGC